MESAKQSISIDSKVLLTAVIIGAVLAPILIILFSFIQADPTIRALPVLSMVAIMGAAGGATVGILNPLQKEGQQKNTFIAISIATYLVDVILGFFLGKFLPF